MIVTAQSRLEEAQRTAQSAERRIRELRMEETAATSRRDYVAATSAARARFLQQDVYEQAVRVMVRGGRSLWAR